MDRYIRRLHATVTAVTSGLRLAALRPVATACPPRAHAWLWARRLQAATDGAATVDVPTGGADVAIPNEESAVTKSGESKPLAEFGKNVGKVTGEVLDNTGKALGQAGKALQLDKLKVQIDKLKLVEKLQLDKLGATVTCDGYMRRLHATVTCEGYMRGLHAVEKLQLYKLGAPCPCVPPRAATYGCVKPISVHLVMCARCAPNLSRLPH